MSLIVTFEDIWGPALEELARRFPVVRLDHADPGLVPDAGTVSAAFVRNKTQVNEGFLTALPQVAVVARVGVGLDNIDIPAADAHGVVVVSPRGANAQSVAEHTLALALAVARQVVVLDATCRRGEWDRRPGLELAGGTWGLVGAGATGLATASLARALGMTVLAHDPHVEDHVLARHGIERASIDALASSSDVVSLHLPSTPQTIGLVGPDFLAAMKPRSILVNVGRGEVIQEDALVNALESGHLAGAALDVRALEPPVNGRLERLPQVVLTPHVGGITTQSQRRILDAVADDVSRVLGGQSARHAVGDVDRMGG